MKKITRCRCDKDELSSDFCSIFAFIVVIALEFEFLLLIIYGSRLLILLFEITEFVRLFVDKR